MQFLYWTRHRASIEHNFTLLSLSSLHLPSLIIVLFFSSNGDCSHIFLSTISALSNFPKVGFFDLDPNRVLSLVLDAYECDPTNDAFLALIGQFKKAYLPHVLGFKFQFYAAQATDAAAATNGGGGGSAESTAETESTKKDQKSKEEEEKDSTSATVSPAAAPPSLYRLTAALLAKHFVSLEDMLPHLSPSLEDCASLDARRQAAMAAAAQGVGRVNLNETAQEAKARKANSSGSSGRNMDGIPSFDDAGASSSSGSSGSESGGGSGGGGRSSGGAEDGEEEEGERASNGRGVAGSNQVRECVCIYVDGRAVVPLVLMCACLLRL